MVTNNYDSSYLNNMNNVIIPTGSDTAQDVNVATFRDENTSLNGQLNILENSSEGRSRTMQSDALGYGTFQPDQIKPATAG